MWSQLLITIRINWFSLEMVTANSCQFNFKGLSNFYHTTFFYVLLLFTCVILFRHFINKSMRWEKKKPTRLRQNVRQFVTSSHRHHSACSWKRRVSVPGFSFTLQFVWRARAGAVLHVGQVLGGNTRALCGHSAGHVTGHLKEIQSGGGKGDFKQWQALF